MLYGQDVLSRTAGKAAAGEVPRGQGMLFSTTSEVSVNKGEMVHPLVGKATSGGEGL